MTSLPPTSLNEEEVGHVGGKCVEKKTIVVKDKEIFEGKFYSA
jgi:hypothetical protein